MGSSSSGERGEEMGSTHRRERVSLRRERDWKEMGERAWAKRRNPGEGGSGNRKCHWCFFLFLG